MIFIALGHLLGLLDLSLRWQWALLDQALAVAALAARAPQWAHLSVLTWGNHIIMLELSKCGKTAPSGPTVGLSYKILVPLVIVTKAVIKFLRLRHLL